MECRLGTVSKILWHFTGGPEWDDTANRQRTTKKTVPIAYNALKAIVTSKTLRVGQYQEIVSVRVPERVTFNFVSQRFEYQKNPDPITVKSNPACCVADIPLQNIGYHSERYGKIAIAFHRESLVKSGFNPVLYTLDKSALLNRIYHGHVELESADSCWAQSEVEWTQDRIDQLISLGGQDKSQLTLPIVSELSELERQLAAVAESYKTMLAYVKTFRDNDFDTIYCEREWRSTEDFQFTPEDIAMIVLPNRADELSPYEDFLREVGVSMLPRTVTVSRWEDLAEH